MMYYHQSLKSNVAGLQRSEFERVLGNGRSCIVLVARGLVTIFESVDMLQHGMGTNNELGIEKSQLWIVIQTLALT